MEAIWRRARPGRSETMYRCTPTLVGGGLRRDHHCCDDSSPESARPPGRSRAIAPRLDMAQRRYHLGIAVLGLAAAPGQAVLASGVMPILALPQSYESHAACVAALKEVYAEDLKQVLARTTDADGRTVERTLSTKGIERIDDNRTRYDALLWFHNGGLRIDLQQTETSHSFEHRIRTCDGAVMTMSGEVGYTLSTFDPIDAPPPQK